MKISQTKDIRSANRLTIIKHILNKKDISRAGISEETGLNKAAPSSPLGPYGLIGISLAVRGIIDLEGVIQFIPKLRWHNVDIKSLLEQRYHVPVYIDNDGNLAASMESRLHLFEILSSHG